MEACTGGKQAHLDNRHVARIARDEPGHPTMSAAVCNAWPTTYKILFLLYFHERRLRQAWGFP
jgi:hypothetical protein